MKLINFEGVVQEKYRAEIEHDRKFSCLSNT